MKLKQKDKITTYDICKTIRKMLTTAAAEVVAYDNWSEEFCAKNIREIPDRIKQMDGYKNVNPCELTKEQMVELGFGRWEEDNPMYLIPLWLFPFLADEFEGEDISGVKMKYKKSEMDNDHRFGCLAYGVIPSTKE